MTSRPVPSYNFECEFCGRSYVQLRRYTHAGWAPDTILCDACFPSYDEENSFTDFSIAQEAYHENLHHNA